MKARQRKFNKHDSRKHRVRVTAYCAIMMVRILLLNSSRRLVGSNSSDGTSSKGILV